MADAGATTRAEAPAAADQGAATAAHADPADVPLVRYSVDLFDAFGAVCDKAKAGVQSCQAVAAFVAERANMEAAYARALNKTAAHARTDDWAPGFAKCWSLVHEMLAGIGKVHTEGAAKMQSTMVAGARAFAAQQEIQVQRLIAEGTKFRTAQLNIVHSMERAKEKYDKRCAEALEILATMRVDAPPTPSNSTQASAATTGLDESKEIVGQLLTRMSSFTKPSMERQRSKLEGCLDELLIAEKHYTQSVEYVNSKQVVLEREIAENLLAFQLTEEQRIEYLKDLLERLHKLFLRNLEASAELVGKLRDSTADINEFVDIEDGFRKLSQDSASDSEVLDPTENAFYQRMCQVQAMSDRGHNVLQNFHAMLVDLMSIEEHFVSSAQRLLRTHDALPSSSGDLFSLSTTLSQVTDEGSSLAAGWQATKEQLQRLWQIRLEFRSLLSEPVALNIATMKHDYENARTTTHDGFSKSHLALCQDSAAHQKLKQKYDAKCREFAQVFASLPDMGEIDLRNLDVDQVLVLVHQLSGAFSEKDKRTETKLKVLGDEVREAQQKLNDSLTALKLRSSQYSQDVDMFISVYMKNEKFRLQVEKSSLVSLTKALDHMVEGAKRSVEAVVEAVDRVDPIKDMTEFVEAHRKPRSKKTKKIIPVYNLDEALKASIDEYNRNKTNAPPHAEEKKHRNGDTKSSPSPLKRSNSQHGFTGSPNKSDSVSVAQMNPVHEERDDQLIGMSDFQKQFKLDSPEQVVESYSCALYANNFPNHGRMYLTSDHLCFSGWRDTIYVVSFLDITYMEKKNSALIVPNALEITAKGEKVFFTSFVFRDECLQRIIQLQAIKVATAAALGSAAKPTIETENPEMSSNAPIDVPSPTTEAPVAPSTRVSDEGVTTGSTASTPSANCESTLSTAAPSPTPPPPRVIPKNDQLLSEFEIVVDEEIPFSVEFAYNTIWVESSAFMAQFLERGGETSITISPWQKTPVTYTSVSKPDSFDGSRRVSYVHNKKYMVGPSAIPTAQTQRFKWETNSRLVMAVTTLVSDAPYCDYFRAENRWVFSNTPKEGACRLQVGISIQWVKSTWLKKQIESTAMGEAKESIRALVDAAIEEAKKHSQTKLSAPPKSPLDHRPPTTPTSSPEPIGIEKAKAVAVEVPDQVVPVEQAKRSPAPNTPSPQAVVTVGSPDNIKALLQIANLVCIILFFYMMYRIGSALDQMQLLARETLVQQRQQQELFREILLKLQAQGRQ